MKKSEKNRASRVAIFFPAMMKVVPVARELKAQMLPLIEDATTRYYHSPTFEFQIAADRCAVKGRLSALADLAHVTRGNDLFSWCSYEER